MKPRNKFEKAVLEQSKHLRPITKTQSKWAFRECIDHFAYRLPKGRTTCMDCGHSWGMNKQRENLHLPSLQGKVAGQGNLRAQVAAEAVFHPTYHLWRVSSIAYVPTYCGYGERVQSTDFYN